MGPLTNKTKPHHTNVIPHQPWYNEGHPHSKPKPNQHHTTIPHHPPHHTTLSYRGAFASATFSLVEDQAFVLYHVVEATIHATEQQLSNRWECSSVTLLRAEGHDITGQPRYNEGQPHTKPIPHHIAPTTPRQITPRGYSTEKPKAVQRYTRQGPASDKTKTTYHTSHHTTHHTHYTLLRHIEWAP